VTRAAGKQASRLDWPRIGRAALRRSGVPTPILLRRIERSMLEGPEHDMGNPGSPNGAAQR